MYFFLIIFSLLKLFKQYFDFCRIKFFLLCLIMNYIIFWDRKFELRHSESAWSLKYQIKRINRVALPVNYETGSCRSQKETSKINGHHFFLFLPAHYLSLWGQHQRTRVFSQALIGAFPRWVLVREDAPHLTASIRRHFLSVIFYMVRSWLYYSFFFFFFKGVWY